MKVTEKIGVAALLVTTTGEILLQQKTNDYKPAPGAVTMFGGGVEKDEQILSALRRELLEELQLKVEDEKIKKFGVYTKGNGTVVHVYTIYDVDPKKLQLHEGEQILLQTAEKHLEDPKLTDITRSALLDYLQVL